MALEELKSIMTHLVEMQRQVLEANKEVVVSLLGRLRSQFQNRLLQDQAWAQALMDELQKYRQPRSRKGFSDMKFTFNLESFVLFKYQGGLLQKSETLHDEVP